MRTAAIWLVTIGMAAAQVKAPLGPPPLPPPDPRLYQTYQVRVPGGGSPGKPAYVEITCNGRTVVSNYTDEKGLLITRLNVESVRGAPGESSVVPSTFSCRAEVVLPGYRSDPHDPFLLRPIGAGEGWSVSITTYQAPEKAHRAYTAGTEALYKKKWDEARRQFEKALSIYPKYASAWYQLGAMHEARGNAAESRRALEKAIQLDSRFLLPYVTLAQLAAAAGNWTEVERITGILMPLNPVEAPAAYYYHASAKLKQNQPAAAEPSARTAVELDIAGRRPEFRYLAGQVMAAQGKNQEAARYFREYLRLAPDAPDATRVRGFIARLE